MIIGKLIERGFTFLMSIIVTAVFNIFPFSGYISAWYNLFGFDWEAVYEQISEAVEDKDSDALTSMASPALKKDNPDLKENLDKMFSEFDGKIVEVTTSHNDDLGEEHIISSYVKTENNQYVVKILYRSVDAPSSHTEVGIIRFCLQQFVGETQEIWVNPEYYFADKSIVFEDLSNVYSSMVQVRELDFQGNTKDEYPFLVVDPTGMYGNTSVTALRRTNPDCHGYVLSEEDCIRVWFVPVGQDVPDTTKTSPDMVLKESEGYNSISVDIDLEPGQYYIYAEPENQEELYKLEISTNC